MKSKVFLLIAAFAFGCFATNAQRGVQIGFVDMDYILSNVPEYQEAMANLDAKVQKWKKEIALKRKTIEGMEQNLENERPLLTQELIEERLAEIKFEEEQLLEYRQKRFGPKGAVFVQKRLLIKPVEDQIFSAIQEIGQTREYDFIFENSADALMLYAANRHDISDQVLSMIKRSSRKNVREETVSDTLGTYKSVKQAKKDRQEEAARQAQLDQRERQRQSKIDARQREMDSLKAAREAVYEAKRAALLKKRAERKRKRDSINQVQREKRSNPEDEK